MVDLNKVAIETKGGLLDYLALVKDPRKRRGIRHAQISILAIAICALLSGAKSFIAIGEWHPAYRRICSNAWVAGIAKG
ncbi:transposase family protein [Desulfofundulus thermocisternus]|uniref:transposase family protein n=1 Tax=Desulfofundulus thermocisternus TaxID=42471 RepID=UPI00217E453F|nr:transposase family protein [Desulfofundulus thermocisternus]MCS5695710.1 transposase family protein [Desulfofundulus thermocisternus]